MSPAARPAMPASGGSRRNGTCPRPRLPKKNNPPASSKSTICGSWPLLTGRIKSGVCAPSGWACSSAGEHYVDIVGVTGSIPVTPTIQSPTFRRFWHASKERRLFRHLRPVRREFVERSRLKPAICPAVSGRVSVRAFGCPLCRPGDGRMIAAIGAARLATRR